MESEKGKVVIEVKGGVAVCTEAPPGIEVEIVDHDVEEGGPYDRRTQEV